MGAFVEYYPSGRLLLRTKTTLKEYRLVEPEPETLTPTAPILNLDESARALLSNAVLQKLGSDEEIEGVNLHEIYRDPEKLELLTILLERFGETPDSKAAFWRLGRILVPLALASRETIETALAVIQALDALHRDTLKPDHFVTVIELFVNAFQAQQTEEARHHFLARAVPLVGAVMRDDFREEKTIGERLLLLEILLEFMKSKEVMEILIRNGSEMDELKRILTLLARSGVRSQVRDAFQGAIPFLDGRLMQILALAGSVTSSDPGQAMAR